MIAVDSSVWIDCFRDEHSHLAKHVQDLILGNEVTINGVILGEVLQGSRNPKEYRRITEAFQVPLFRESNLDSWHKAATIAYEMRRKGFQPPFTDCIIAALCLIYDDALLTLDKHFSAIAKLFPLKLVS